MRTLPVVLVALVAAVACGKESDGPCNQNPIAPACIDRITISPDTNLLKIKATEVFSVTTMGVNGNRTVQAAWSSDTVAVATVDSAGHATGVAPGEATIVADFQGLQDKRLLRVVPDYHGQWSGGQAVTSCTADGAWAEVDGCAEFPVGDLYWFALALTQNRDSVTGTVDFGEPGPVSGSIRTSGHLVVDGTFTATTEGLPLAVAVSDWETLSMDNEQMSGHFTLRFSLPGVSGSLLIGNDLRSVTKTSSTPLIGRATRNGPKAPLSALVRRLRRE